MPDFIDDAVEKAQITLTTESMTSGELRCQLRNDNFQLIRDIRIRDGASASISASAILYHLVLNVQALRMCDGFDDWLAEFEIDLPKSQARAKYVQLQNDNRDLELLLGTNLCISTLAALEIHQAISNARGY